MNEILDHEDGDEGEDPIPLTVQYRTSSSSSSVSSGERKDTIDHHDLPLSPTASLHSSRPTSPCLSLTSRTSSSCIPPPPRAGLVRILSNASIGSESPTCPICLDPMTPIDHQHPLLCPTRHCHFNLCATCISSLLSSSKDDYAMASDGNAHVKVFLNCPNCRSDLSSTIRDVLLLRKVDTVQWLTSMKSSPKLSPSQERTQRAMQELHVQEAIQQARDVEAQFWDNYQKDHYHTNNPRHPPEAEEEEEESEESAEHLREQLARFEVFINDTNCSIELSQSYDDEEWGVEADLDTGVHNSIHLPSDQMMSGWFDENTATNKEHSATTPKKTIDTTLFSGLEFCMTYAEKLQLTQWLTSGDVSCLANAAVLQRQLEQYARQGVTPAKRQASINRRASVYEIVDEARKLHDQQKEMSSCEQGAPTVPSSAYLTSTRNPLRQQQLAAERRRMDQVLQEQAMLLERYPLPVRMPKCVELQLRDPTARRFPLRFCNDTWDGTVLDAFSKLTVSGRAPNSWSVSKKKTQHAGVFHVLSLGRYSGHYGCIEMTMEQPARVLVASVWGDAGRQGIIKGDVVTHIDGQEFHGTVEDLTVLLQNKAKDGNSKTFQMILNAESSIAEALRRRAMVFE